MTRIKLFLLMIVFITSCGGPKSLTRTVPADASRKNDMPAPPRCQDLGPDWKSDEQFACQSTHSSKKNPVFALKQIIPTGHEKQVLSLHDKELALEDWLEDDFLRFSGFSIGSMPSACSVNEQVACLKTLVQDQEGTPVHVLGLTNGQHILFMWQKKTKPNLNEAVRLLNGSAP